jgi:ribA/ribD-fused uncharacterized protein
MINSFTGEYRFLSNFYPVCVMLDGDWYPTVEHAYQAAKTNNISERINILNCKSPGDAKRVGKTVNKTSTFDTMKVTIMRALLVQKFRNPCLRKALFETGSKQLIEGNSWGDTFWGVCNNKGENILGKLLMEIRITIREDDWK